MIKQIKIYFSDFWAHFDYSDNHFVSALKMRFEVVVDSENPDYLIYSTFGTNFLNYKNAVKILFVGENVRPNYTECDFSLGFDYETYGGRNLRYPLYVLYGFLPGLLDKKIPELILSEKSQFCNMVVSNESSKQRIHFFNLLSALKHVDSGGLVLNNVGGPVKDKLAFIKKYRFTMAFENVTHPGYTTEKIFEPMKVNSIPIYWGNKRIGEEFNTKSFVNVHDYGSLKEAAEAVIDIDQNPLKLASMLAEPWFNNNKLTEYFDNDRLCNFFEEYVLKKKISPNIFHIRKRQALAHLNVYRKKVVAKILRMHYSQIS